MENNKIIIGGYAYWETEPDNHLPIPVCPEAFDAPIKSVELCVQNDMEVTVIKFGCPVTKMSENIFAIPPARLRKGYIEDTSVKLSERKSRWEYFRIDTEDFFIELPDTLVDYIPIDHELENSKYLSRITEPWPLFNGKYSCEGGDFWAVDGNIKFWVRAFYDDFGVHLEEFTNIKSVPPYFYNDIDAAGKLILPPNLEKIGKYAFSNMRSIKQIKMPKTLKVISPNSMFNNSSLVQISLVNVEEIGENAFSGCGLSRVKLSKNLKKIGEGAFSSCNRTKFFGPEKFVRENGTSLVSDNIMILFPSFKYGECPEYTTPDGLTRIGNYANGQSLRSDKIIVSNGIQSIGKYAFSSVCVKTISLPDSLLEIDEGAFRSSYLISIVIPPKITEIKKGLFEECIALQSVTILGDLSVFYNSLFFEDRHMQYKFSKFKELIIHSKNPPTFVEYMNENCSQWMEDHPEWLINHLSTGKIIVPKDSVDAYKSADGWSKYADNIFAGDF